MSFTGLICFILLVLAYAGSSRLAYRFVRAAWGEPDDVGDQWMMLLIATLGGAMLDRRNRRQRERRARLRAERDTRCEPDAR